MVLEYEIAKLNIRISSDFDIAQGGSSPLFASGFEKSDIDINISLGNAETDGSFVCRNKFSDIYRSANGSYSSVYYAETGEKRKEYFLKTDNGCVLSADSDKAFRDMFHLWGMIGLPHLLISKRRLMMHCSYIIHNGEAILFCGKSGAGKSTQAALWREYENADTVNGDKAVIFSENGKLFASSLPISGTSNICKNRTARVRAIIVLSHGEDNSVSKPEKLNSISLLASNCISEYWRDFETLDVIDLCTEFSQLAEIYEYKCLPDKTAVDYLKKVIE